MEKVSSLPQIIYLNVRARIWTGNVRDAGSIPGWERSLGEGNGNPLQYSCLRSPTDRGAWRGYSPWGHEELDMTELLGTEPHNPAVAPVPLTTESWFSQEVMAALLGRSFLESSSLYQDPGSAEGRREQPLWGGLSFLHRASLTPWVHIPKEKMLSMSPCLTYLHLYIHT